MIITQIYRLFNCMHMTAMDAVVKVAQETAIIIQLQFNCVCRDNYSPLSLTISIGWHSAVKQIERVFGSAAHQKVWDHFTKAQRKNITAWKKQLQVRFEETRSGMQWREWWLLGSGRLVGHKWHIYIASLLNHFQGGFQHELPF